MALKVVLTADASQLEQETNKAEKKVKGFESSIKDSLASAAKWGAGVAAAAAAAGIAMTKMGMTAVGAQQALATSMNATMGSIVALSLAAKDSGIPDFDSSLARLNRRLGAAAHGGGAAAGVVQRLGLDLQALSKLDADQKIASIADSMKKAGLSASEMARAAQDLGFEQREAVGFFNQGGAAILAYRKEVDELGMSLSDVDAAKVGSAQAALDKIGVIVSSIGKAMAVEVAPIIEAVSRLFIQAAKDAGGVGNAVAEGSNMAIKALTFVANAVDGIKRSFEIAGKVIAGYFFVMQNQIRSVFEGVANTAIGSVNAIIGAMNKIPKVDIDLLENVNLGAISASEAIKMVGDDIDEILNRPLAGDRFQEFVAEAKAASEEAARIAVENNQVVGEIRNQGVAAEKQAMDSRLASLMDYHKTEQQLLSENLLAQHNLIAEQREQGIISDDEYKQLMLNNQQQYEDAMTAIQQQAAEQRKKVLSGALSSMTTLMNSHSRKMFEIGKVAAIAQSLIATYQGATEALKLGWPLGPLAAAAITTAGLANVQQIKKQGMNKGGGGGSTPTASINEASQPTQTVQRNVSVSLVGSVFSRDQVRGLMGAIGEELGDNVALAVT